jgi:hypothetical protein
VAARLRLRAAQAGVVNHIPVCDTLAQLTAYFNGGNAQGSTHFGIGCEQWGRSTGPTSLSPRTGPPAHADQRPSAPWAQGLIQTRPPDPAVAHDPYAPGRAERRVYLDGERRCTGRDGVTDPQFNSNVMLRAYCAAFGFEVSPPSQLWHSEITRLA